MMEVNHVLNVLISKQISEMCREIFQTERRYETSANEPVNANKTLI